MAPTPSDILGVVMSQKSDVAALFDELRAGSRDGDGVTRDTYGPGEEFAHRLIAAHAGLAAAVANLAADVPRQCCPEDIL